MPATSSLGRVKSRIILARIRSLFNDVINTYSCHANTAETRSRIVQDVKQILDETDPRTTVLGASLDFEAKIVDEQIKFFPNDFRTALILAGIDFPYYSVLGVSSYETAHGVYSWDAENRTLLLHVPQPIEMIQINITVTNGGS